MEKNKNNVEKDLEQKDLEQKDLEQKDLEQNDLEQKEASQKAENHANHANHMQFYRNRSKDELMQEDVILDNPDLVDELIDGRWTMDEEEFDQKYSSLNSSDMFKVASATIAVSPFLEDDIFGDDSEEWWGDEDYDEDYDDDYDDYDGDYDEDFDD